MSEKRIDSISSHRKKGEENNKKNKINHYQQLGYLHDKNNKNNIPSEEDNKNSINNIKNTNNANNDLSLMPNNRAILNTAFEFDLINNTQVQNTKNSKSSNKKSKKAPNKTNNSYLYLSNSSRDNLISNTNMMVQTTTDQSGNIYNLKKKYLDLYKNNTKLKKNKTLPNLKKYSFSQTKIESFLERVKEKQKLKELHINNMRSKSIENETSEMNVHPKMNKTSIILLKNNNRKPLYQEKPLIEEKNLEKNFQDFYAQTLLDNQANPYLINSNKKKNIKDINDKYNKFYEDKMKWKNNVEQKNKNRKLLAQQEKDEYIENFPFKPSLNKNSLYIANNKLYRNKSIDNFSNNNNFFETGNERDALNKFKTKLKSIIYNFNNYNNNHQPILNRKNGKFKRTVSVINFDKKVNINNGNNKYINKKQKPKINYKLNEKKYIANQNNDKIEKKEMNNNNINEKDFIFEQKEEFKNKSPNKQNKSEYDKEDLYKLNVRPGAAWNNEVVNKITPLKQYNRLIKELI